MYYQMATITKNSLNTLSQHICAQSASFIFKVVIILMGEIQKESQTHREHCSGVAYCGAKTEPGTLASQARKSLS